MSRRDPNAMCVTCEFYCPTFPNHGDCRRHPPVVVMDHKGEWAAEWPNVSAEGWCGERVPFFSGDKK